MENERGALITIHKRVGGGELGAARDRGCTAAELRGRVSGDY
jgi:hypothetical protein